MTPHEATEALLAPLPLSVHNRGLIANLIHEQQNEIWSLRQAQRKGQP